NRIETAITEETEQRRDRHLHANRSHPHGPVHPDNVGVLRPACVLRRQVHQAANPHRSENFGWKVGGSLLSQNGEVKALRKPPFEFSEVAQPLLTTGEENRGAPTPRQRIPGCVPPPPCCLSIGTPPAARCSHCRIM